VNQTLRHVADALAPLGGTSPHGTAPLACRACWLAWRGASGLVASAAAGIGPSVDGRGALAGVVGVPGCLKPTVNALVPPRWAGRAVASNPQAATTPGLAST
jgi:hypothetical protein